MRNDDSVTRRSENGSPGLQRARQRVAAALLERSGGSDTGSGRFTVKTMASAAGAEWGTIRLSLKSLQDEGAIRLERHRIYINRDALRRAANPEPSR